MACSPPTPTRSTRTSWPLSAASWRAKTHPPSLRRGDVLDWNGKTAVDEEGPTWTALNSHNPREAEHAVQKPRWCKEDMHVSRSSVCFVTTWLLHLLRGCHGICRHPRLVESLTSLCGSPQHC